MAGYEIHVDMSELDGLLNDMKKRITPENFDRLMRRTLNEVGKGMKAPIRKEVQKQYAVKGDFVNRGIKSPRISGSGGGISCIIPLQGPKGNIGSTFTAAGGKPGWVKKRYKVRAHIVKSGRSVLPPEMSHQGGQPPFRNTAAPSLNGLVFTRSGKDRLPIERVSALALPQMPLNRAKPEIEKEILERAEKRVIHNFGHMFG